MIEKKILQYGNQLYTCRPFAISPHYDDLDSAVFERQVFRRDRLLLLIAVITCIGLVLYMIYESGSLLALGTWAIWGPIFALLLAAGCIPLADAYVSYKIMTGPSTTSIQYTRLPLNRPQAITISSSSVGIEIRTTTITRRRGLKHSLVGVYLATPDHLFPLAAFETNKESLNYIELLPSWLYGRINYNAAPVSFFAFFELGVE